MQSNRVSKRWLRRKQEKNDNKKGGKKLDKDCIARKKTNIFSLANGHKITIFLDAEGQKGEGSWFVGKGMIEKKSHYLLKRHDGRYFTGRWHAEKSTEVKVFSVMKVGSAW